MRTVGMRFSAAQSRHHLHVLTEALAACRSRQRSTSSTPFCCQKLCHSNRAATTAPDGAGEGGGGGLHLARHIVWWSYGRCCQTRSATHLVAGDEPPLELLADLNARGAATELNPTA